MREHPRVGGGVPIRNVGTAHHFKLLNGGRRPAAGMSWPWTWRATGAAAARLGSYR